ncbi:uncharacterized protein (DUF924 family) [Hephaestia caeni]|uniref:Uncharacterized protein (DUF924 family) n=1 Tax=Hephaestia caeni TaxID=645617 RepID=A0A397P7Y0_9SPHN|nr:DUF924 family protein [Hephaestia caeni]RIA45650.1 uncharacterized protein (DUF924 family) [Hephaestia caeni]
MADDLGIQPGEVHGLAEAVLAFWLDEVPADKRFAKDAALDAVIKARFGVLLETLIRADARGWRDDPRTLLAAVIVIDQFSRNIHRGQAQAFAADPLALSLTKHAITRGWDVGMTVTERQFVYMPMMHAEDRAVQQRSLHYFATLDDDFIFGFAKDHADVIARFGRFPSRNAALGRVSTPEEETYLNRPDAGW